MKITPNVILKESLLIFSQMKRQDKHIDVSLEGKIGTPAGQYGVAVFPGFGWENRELSEFSNNYLRPLMQELRNRIDDEPQRNIQKLENALGVEFSIVEIYDNINMRLIIDNSPVDWCLDRFFVPSWGKVQDWYNINYDVLERRFLAPMWRFDVRFLQP